MNARDYFRETMEPTTADLREAQERREAALADEERCDRAYRIAARALIAKGRDGKG